MFVYPESYILTTKGFVQARELENTSFTIKTNTNNNILITKKNSRKCTNPINFIQVLFNTGFSLTLPVDSQLKNGVNTSNITKDLDITGKNY